MKINNLEIKIDTNYQQVDSLPDDPPESVPFCFQTDMALCFVILMPISMNKSMPFGNVKSVIDGIHDCLGDEQGLIQVDAGETKTGKKYIYSIVKTVKSNGESVFYCLTLHFSNGNDCIQIQGFFEESGTTGIRDTTIFGVLMNAGKIKMGDNGPEGWMNDPYNPNFDRGISKNISENEDFDEMFPTHPLSECRRFLKDFVERN